MSDESFGSSVEGDHGLGRSRRPWARRDPQRARIDELTRQVLDLREQVHGLGRVLDNLAEGVVAVDHAGCVVHVNPVASRLLGIRADRAIGSNMYAVVDSAAVCEALGEAMAGDADTHVHREAEIDRPMGTRQLTIHATPLRELDREGDAEGAVAVVQDITDLRRLENARADFFTNVSHELKTPVTAIRGIVETMRDDPQMDAAVRKSFLDKAVGQTVRLGDLVHDLLALSRLESDPGALDRQAVDLISIAGDAITACAAAAEQARVDLVLEVAVPRAFVFGDDEALRQAISNLVVNAITYSRAGDRVLISIDPDAEEWVLTVADTGTGIAPEHRDRIFERFFRADKARSRERGGTGLGLSIVKHAMLAHGGDVAVESTVGIGSTFRLRLPSI